MAHIWHSHPASGGWSRHPLPVGGAALLSQGGGLRASELQADGPVPGDAAAVCMPAAGAADTPSCGTWVLLARKGARLRVNGQALTLGLRVLRDRDEIWLEGHRCFFSDEQLALVAPYPESLRRADCPRCRQPLEPGQPAVRCPSCQAWHHASESLPCWSYAPTCAVCRRQQTGDPTRYNFNPDTL
jgi:LSD1 subclass zinc finger protein